MNIVLNTKSSTKRSKNKLQNRFDALRKQLEKQQNVNSKLHKELDELVTMYQTHMFDVGKERVIPLTKLTEKLITFSTRKSLSMWHREEISEWIHDSLDCIAYVAPEAADNLHASMRQEAAEQLGITIEQLDEEAKRYQEAMQEAAREEYNPFASEEETIDFSDHQEDMFGFDEFFKEHASGNGESFFGSDTSNQTPEPEKMINHQCFTDGSWVRDLFRRTAQALHPDREPDPKQRQNKEDTMKQLLEARKQGDVMALLQLYTECVTGEDLVLAQQEMNQVCELLEQQIRELRQKKTELIYQNPLHALVHDLLYSRSHKTREKKIQAWKRELRMETEHTITLTAELRNLKNLKSVLESRREEKFLFFMGDTFNESW